MDRHERWILEAAVEVRLSLCDLTGPRVPERLNRPHHGLDAAGVAEVLRVLLRKGFITLFRGAEEELTEGRDALVWLAEHGDDERPNAPVRGTTYGLTASGGAAWETVARPDWSRYIDGRYGSDPFDAEVICPDPVRLDEYVFSKFQECRPIRESLRRDRLEPWAATYWKVLPLGHRVRFAYHPEPDPLPREWNTGFLRERYAWLKEVNDWFRPSET